MKKSFLGILGVALLGTIAILTTKSTNKESDSAEEEYYPTFNNDSEIIPKKKYPSDFELADFCCGGDLTED